MAFPDICRVEFTNWTAIQNQIAALKSAKDAALRALKDALKSARDLVSRGFDEALNDLSAMDERQGRIVELKYFGGLSEQEVAEALSVSRATVTREWRRARAWLYHRMTPAPMRGPA